MKYNTHMVGGLALGYMAFNHIDYLGDYLSNSTDVAIVSALLVAGSLLPDIDISTSYMSRKTRPISFFTSKFFKHRGYTHSIVGILSITLIFYLVLGMFSYTEDILRMASLSLLIGMSSHVLLDMMTHSGVELFYPLKKRVNAGKLTIVNNLAYGFSELVVAVLLGFIAYRGFYGLI